MYRHPRRPLIAPRQIIRNPRHVPRECWIDSAYGDEDSRVDDAGDVSGGGGGDADYEADADGAHAGEDVGAALAGAIGEPGYGDGEDGGGDVDGDGEELGCGGGVAEFADDGGEEEGGAVEGADDAPVHWLCVSLWVWEIARGK